MVLGKGAFASLVTALFAVCALFACAGCVGQQTHSATILYLDGGGLRDRHADGAARAAPTVGRDSVAASTQARAVLAMAGRWFAVFMIVCGWRCKRGCVVGRGRPRSASSPFIRKCIQHGAPR